MAEAARLRHPKTQDERLPLGVARAVLLEGDRDCACMPERQARSAKAAVSFGCAAGSIFAFV